MKDKLLIKINIGGKLFPLVINRNEREEIIARNAAAQINGKLEQYRQKYSSTKLSPDDLLSMVALQLSQENLQLEERTDTSIFEERIKTWALEIEDYLNKQK